MRVVDLQQPLGSRVLQGVLVLAYTARLWRQRTTFTRRRVVYVWQGHPFVHQEECSITTQCVGSITT